MKTIALVLVVVGSVACGGDKHTNDQNPDLAPALCPGAVAADACGVCMQGACCDAVTACEGDADCLSCVSGSGSDPEACERTSATHARVDAFLQCKGGASCRETCIGASSGACAGALDGLTTTVCQTCLETSCCAEVAACHEDDGVCWDGCLTNHNEATCHGNPDSHSLFHALSGCWNSNCASACN